MAGRNGQESRRKHGRVHYYKDGMTLCGQSRKMDMELPDWKGEDTCQHCGKLVKRENGNDR